MNISIQMTAKDAQDTMRGLSLSDGITALGAARLSSIFAAAIQQAAERENKQNSGGTAEGADDET